VTSIVRAVATGTVVALTFNHAITSTTESRRLARFQAVAVIAHGGVSAVRTNKCAPSVAIR
jgi:hypothetical protein